MPALAYRSTLPRPDDPDIIATVSQALKDGHGMRAAAAFARVSKTTLYDWWQLGLEELRTGVPGSHAAFADAVEQSYAAFEAEQLHYVKADRDKAKGWLPAMTLLDRRNPEEWGQRQQMQIEQRTLGVNVSITLGPESSEALAELLGRRSTKLLPEAT